MPQKVAKRRAKSQDKRSKNSSATQKGEPPPDTPVKTGRKTNNSLASATGQIVIPDNDEPASSTRKKLKTSQIQSEEDIKTDMYKVLEQITAHDDAWPFMDPVEEEYAPNYYAVIRRPMDLRKMEERLDTGHYRDFASFKADFKLIVNNCRLYNGQDNEYTVMVDSLAAAFDRLTEKYMHRISSSDEEIAVEFQIPTPSRKHKLKRSESPQVPQKKRKRKSHSESEPKSSSSDLVPEHAEASDPGPKAEPELETKKSKESHKNKDGKGRKKRKGHHRRGKHSKKRRESKSGEGEDMEREERKKKKQKSKNKEKKSKQKKKKSKHQEPEPEPVPVPVPMPVPVPVPVSVRADTPGSMESSSRSRSASPLPSIRSDKYDKIKERRRGAAKDVWESLFDYKQKCALDKLKNLAAPEKDKNSKLRETIEKLKAKNTEKYKESPSIRNVFSPTHGKSKKKDKEAKSKEPKEPKSKEPKQLKSKETKSKEPKLKEPKPKEPKLKEPKTKPKDLKTKDKETNETEEIADDSAEDDEPIKKPAKAKSTNKRGPKKSSAKNESATEALEEAVKDMTKWFEDGPKSSAVSSPADSPAHTISTEEQDSRHDDELSQSEKSSTFSRREASTSRKRHASREPKLVKRREIQRTIDRLQPGKSKGNLLTNVIKKDAELREKEESASPGAAAKVREAIKSEESSPKLSLGSVLPTVEFTLGKDHKFDKKEAKQNATTTDNIKPEQEIKPEECVEKKEESLAQVEKKEDEAKREEVQVTKKDAEVETEPQAPMKPNQATPNLSAWFKAFGAPKSNPPVVSAASKKKTEDGEEERPAESAPPEARPTSPANPDTPLPEGGESPLPNPTATPRQRRTSTGSSVSERSSFSQDLDSPRHQMSLTSPLLRSPASPRDDFQKITYPIINGSVRAGFYQDTTSIRSSPEKSCSPREGPASPYSPYSQHVYAGNNAAGSATPQYFVDHNKSPLPTYTQNPPPYYDTAKATVGNKPHAHEDYTSLGPDTFQQNQLPRSYSPVYSPFTQSSSNYPPVQNPPQSISSNITSSISPVTVDTKSATFPMKKRMYNEPEQSAISPTKLVDNKEALTTQNKNEYTKPTHSTPAPPTSVDDIALALSEKSELAKLREKNAADNAANSEKHSEERDTATMEQVDSEREIKKDTNANGTKSFGTSNKDNIDMVNMGYMNPDYERRVSGETHEGDFSAIRDKPKTNANTQHKVYDVDTLALNLGINNQPLHKTLTKNTMSTPAHSQVATHERSHNDMNINQHAAHSHHLSHYEHLSGGQTINNFSMSDIELANKKLYTGNTTPSSAAIDYGNWKLSQMRKQEMLTPSDYSAAYQHSVNQTEKHKQDIMISSNYNKNLQQQYNMYNVPRANTQRTQDLQQMLPAELRIPNPRGHLKNDHMTTPSPVNDPDPANKHTDSAAKSHKAEKLVQNHPLVSSNPYKTPYSNAALQLDSLRNLQNIPQMLERYSNDERFLSSFASSSSALYDKQFQMAQMFNKSMASELPTSSAPSGVYTQPSMSLSKDSSIYKASHAANPQPESKPKQKRKKRTSESKSAQRNSAEAGAAEKLTKPAHQASSAFPFMGHGQVRPGYGFVGGGGVEPGSPLYQQYLQRQEELLRQTGAQIMGLYPPPYPPSLGVSQPYDSINMNRHSWL
ncbi:Uncharacterized protein OBRU01_16750, partial [Operophtera brumata]